MSIPYDERIRHLLVRGIERIRTRLQEFEQPQSLQIARAVDMYFLLAAPPDPRGISPEFDLLFSMAAGPLIRLSQSLHSEKSALPASLSPRELKLFPSLVEDIGKMARIWMALDLSRDGVYRITKKSAHSFRLLENEIEPVECQEVMHYIEHSSRRRDAGSGQLEALERAKKMYRWPMELLAQKEGYPGYRPENSEIDKVATWYLRRSCAQLSYTLGIEEWLPGHSFGGVECSLMRRVIEGLHAVVSIHADIELIKHEFGRDMGVGAFTFFRRPEGLAREIADVSNLTTSDVLQVLHVIAEPATAWRSDKVFGATPPALLRMEGGNLLPVFAGIEPDPFDAIMKHFQQAYPRDYFDCVNSREQMFIDDIQKLFPPQRYSLSQSPLVLRMDGRTLTDVDLAVFDTTTGELALFQLKWQSPFGVSPTERRSKVKNFTEQCTKWAQSVGRWLEDNLAESLVKRFVASSSRDIKVTAIRLFGIGRNFSRGTELPLPGGELAISNWYRFHDCWLRACLESRPISAIHCLLRDGLSEGQTLHRQKLIHSVVIDGVLIELKGTVATRSREHATWI